MTESEAAERQRRQRERDRAAGLTEVTVKVPKECAETIREIAREMRGRKLVEVTIETTIREIARKMRKTE